MKRTLAALALILIVASPAQAAKPAAGGGNGSLTFTLQPDVQTDRIVEQQTDWAFPADPAEWVVNPYGVCLWDVDDHWQYWGSGSLKPGESASVDLCVVSDPVSIYKTVSGVTTWYSQETKFIALSVTTAKTAGLDVSVCYRPQGRCFYPHPVGSSPVTYESCTQVRYGRDDPALSEIPGSQGGIGVLTTVTVTVTNPTSRTVRDVVAAAGPSWLQAGSPLPGCAGRVGAIVMDYPYRFSTS